MNDDASSHPRQSTQSAIEEGRQLAGLAGHLSTEDPTATLTRFLSALNPILLPIEIQAEK